MKMQFKELALLLSFIYAITNIHVECVQDKGHAESIRKVDNMPEIDIGEYAIVNNGANVTINCNELDENAEEFTWQFQGVDLEFTGFIAQEPYSKIHQYREGEITILKIDDDYVGEYKCTSVMQDGTEMTDATTLEVSNGCPRGCEGDIGEKGYMGQRGREGAAGRQGSIGVCYPEQCPKPIQGEKGDSGPDGRKGEMGSNGENGQKGIQGDFGDEGIQGTRGDRGSRGDRGPDGNAGSDGQIGEKGSDGERGISGIKGDEGEKGVFGQKGQKGEEETGPQGQNGERGNSGENGENGIIGATGEDGNSGSQGDKGQKGVDGLRGNRGEFGSKGNIGKEIIVKNIDSINNPNCNLPEYEQGQIIYDTAMNQFIYCDGNNFQCIRDKPCFEEECIIGEQYVTIATKREKSLCVNLVWVFDESASMQPEHIWLREVSGKNLPREITVLNEALQRNNTLNCDNIFSIVTYGGDLKSESERLGRIIPLEEPGYPLNWGTPEDVEKALENIFEGSGGLEDGYAAIYRAIRMLDFQALSCKKVVIFSDENRDIYKLPFITSTEAEIIPYLEFNIMKDILTRHSIQLSGVIEFEILVDGFQNGKTIGLYSDGRAITCEGTSSDPNIVIQPKGTVQPESGNENTVEAYVKLIHASGGIAWSLPKSRQTALQECFTQAFIQFEVSEAIEGCYTTTCQNCTCPEGKVTCDTINPIGFVDVAEQCSPATCDQSEYIKGFQRPACVDEIFTVDESSSEVESFMKTVAIQLPPILRSINFGQLDSTCQNMYGLLLYGSDADEKRRRGLPYKFGNNLFETSSVVGEELKNITFLTQGNIEDGYVAIFETIREYTFRGVSSRQITLVTNKGRDVLDSGVTKMLIKQELEAKDICLNVIVSTSFRTTATKVDAIGLINTGGVIYAVVVDGTDYRLVEGGEVVPQSPEENTKDAYIDLALDGLCGSAWSLRKARDFVVSFTKAFVIESVVKVSQERGVVEACVFCECVTKKKKPCITVDSSSSPVCRTGIPPSLAYTSGTYNVTQNNEFLVGGVVERGEGSRETIYVLDSNQTNFILYSQLRTGTTPVNVMWYYKENKADREINDLSQEANPNGDTSLLRYRYESNTWKEGYYYINVSNAYGYDYQIARIVFVPKWSHRWESTNDIFSRGTGFFGETLRVEADSELRLSEYVVQGTKSWAVKYFVNEELVAESGPGGNVIYNNDFRIEKSGDRYTLVLSSFQSKYSGSYAAYVSNEFGSNIVISSIVTGIHVTCNSDPSVDTTSCPCAREGNQLVYTLYGHSFPESKTLEWVVRDQSNNKIDTLSKIVAISETMTFMLPANAYCENGPAIVSAQIESQDEIRFICSCDADCNDAACCERRDILIESTCGENFADILVLIDISSSMELEHDFLVTFIPKLESDLRKNCIGESQNEDNKNHYTFVAFGGREERTLPYFVGPDYDLVRDSGTPPFTIDLKCTDTICTSENITKLREKLPADGDTEDGYAATKFALTKSVRRNGALTIVFLVTDEAKGYPFITFIDLIEKSFFEIDDQGKALYTQFLKDNQVIQVSILNTNLIAKDENNNTVKCIGLNSEFKCSYAENQPDGTIEIKETRRDVKADLGGSTVRNAILDDYINTALNADGFIFDLNVLRSGDLAATNAVSEALRKEIGFRALLDLSACESCLCLMGENVECSNLAEGKVADKCKCLQTIAKEDAFQADTTKQENFCSCLIDESRSTKYCRCRFEDGLNELQCTQQEQLVVVN